METTRFDAAEYLKTPEDVAFFLSDALETGDEDYIYRTFGIVARSRGMSEVERQNGVEREALYRALSEDGKPQFSTVLGVLNVLGLRLKVTTAE